MEELLHGDHAVLSGLTNAPLAFIKFCVLAPLYKVMQVYTCF